MAPPMAPPIAPPPPPVPSVPTSSTTTRPKPKPAKKPDKGAVLGDIRGVGASILKKTIKQSCYDDLSYERAAACVANAKQIRTYIQESYEAMVEKRRVRMETRDMCLAASLSAIARAYKERSGAKPSTPIEGIKNRLSMDGLKKCMMYTLQRHALTLLNPRFDDYLLSKKGELRKKCATELNVKRSVDVEKNYDIERLREGKMTIDQFWNKKWSRRPEAWGKQFRADVFDTPNLVDRTLDALSLKMAQAKSDGTKLVADLKESKSSMAVARMLAQGDEIDEAVQLTKELRDSLSTMTDADRVFKSLKLFADDEQLCVESIDKKNQLLKEAREARDVYDKAVFRERARKRYEALDTPGLKKEVGESDEAWRERRREAAAFRRTYRDPVARNVWTSELKIVENQRGKISQLLLASKVKKVRDKWLAKVKENWTNDFGEIPIPWLKEYLEEGDDAAGYLNPEDGERYSVMIDFKEASEGRDLFQNLEDCNNKYIELLNEKTDTGLAMQVRQQLEETRAELDQVRKEAEEQGKMDRRLEQELRSAQRQLDTQLEQVQKAQAELDEVRRAAENSVMGYEDRLAQLNTGEVAQSEGERVVAAFQQRRDFEDESLRARMVRQLRQYFGRCDNAGQGDLRAQGKELCETLSYVGSGQSVCVWDRLKNKCVDNHDVAFLMNAIDSVCFECERMDTELLRRIAQTMLRDDDSDLAITDWSLVDGCAACKLISDKLNEWEETFETQYTISRWDRAQLDEFKVLLKSAAQILMQSS